MNTRILKYSKLRKEIEKNIKSIEFKEKNEEKLNKFKKLLNNIDKKIFYENQLYSEKIFPNFTSFSKIEEIKNQDKLIETLNQIKEWKEKIEEIKNWKTKTEINDYIPDLENENFIYNNLNLIKTKNNNMNKNFQNIKNKKWKIIKKSKNINELKTKDLNLENVISENISNIEHQKEIIKKISKLKKGKTKWIWIFNLFLLTLQTICLILLIIKI